MALAVSDSVTITVEDAVPDELESGTYDLTLHCNTFAVAITKFVAEVAGAFFELVAEGVTYIRTRIEDRPKGDDRLDFAHTDIIVRFSVASPVAVSTIIALILLVLIVWGIVFIVWDIEKVTPVAGLGVVGFLLLALFLAPKRRD